MNRAWKQAALAGGALLALVGLLLLPAGLCWLSLMLDHYADGRDYGMVWLPAVAITFGGGVLLYRHANRSLQGKPSRALRLPPLWALGWGLLLALVIGETLRRTFWGALFFPPVYLLAAALPPVAAVAWGSRHAPEGLTWRQFTVAFFVGATVSVALAILLEIILPTLVLALVGGMFEWAREAWGALLEALAGREVARELGSYGFLLALIQLAVVAPLAEEFAKPLMVLPMIKQAKHPRQAFLIGAAAGAGFAALENLLYTGFGVRAWGGVVAVRALGAAVHPLGAGLVALVWYSLFHPNVGRISNSYHVERISNSLYVGLAVGVHALWNGGIVLLLALVSADFFGPAPPEVEVIGVTLAGVLLALLAAVGAAAWIGVRVILRSLRTVGATEGVGLRMLEQDKPLTASFGRPYMATDRAIAVWAVLCLVVALPLGLAALRALGGGG